MLQNISSVHNARRAILRRVFADGKIASSHLDHD